jgi:hypothetical protein
MRSAVAIGIVLMFVGSGCTRFAGEWLEEGSIKRDGTFVAVEGDRRTALRFDWPATIRMGSYADLAGVVDDETVQWDQYWTLKNDRVAQSGAMSATVHGKRKDKRLVMVVDGDVRKQFVKLRGPSVFPPTVKFPSLNSQ